jgi:hypothetical protein
LNEINFNSKSASSGLEGVYWIKNIIASKPGAPVVESVTPANGISGIRQNQAMIFNFNVPLLKDSVHKENIQITAADGSPLPKSAYNAVCNGNALTVKYLTRLSENTAYEVHISGLMSGDGIGRIMTGEYIYTFTAVSNDARYEVDLSGYPDGTDITGIDGFDTTVAQPGHNITVDTDVNGDKAIKFEITASAAAASVSDIRWEFPKLSGDGFVRYSFDLNIPNPQPEIHQYLWGKANNATPAVYHLQETGGNTGIEFFYSAPPPAAANSVKKTLAGGMSWTDYRGAAQYVRISPVIDFTSGKHGAYYTKKDGSVLPGGSDMVTTTTPEQCTKYISNRIIPDYVNVFSFTGKTPEAMTKNEVFWLKNIWIEKTSCPTVTNAFKDGNGTVYFDFNMPLSADSVNKENVRVYENGIALLDDSEYGVKESYNDDNGNSRIVLNISRDRAALKNYTVKINGVAGVSKAGFPMTAEYEYDFMTDEVYGIHVSPGGDDSAAGSIAAPFKTIERAVLRMREYRSENALPNAPVNIYLRGGVYRLNNTVTLRKEDGGVYFSAYNGEEASVRGSIRLDEGGFVPVSDENILARIPSAARDKVFQFNLAELTGEIPAPPAIAALSAGTGYFELYSGGEEQILARYPNNGYMLTGEILSAAGSAAPEFAASSGNLSAWADAPDLMAKGYWGNDWSAQGVSAASVASAASENNSLTLSKKPDYSVKEGSRYFVYNLLEELDAPGEWYIERSSKTLYWYPPQNIAAAELSLSPNDLIKIEAGACDIGFSGLSFEYTRATGLSADGVCGITVKGCEFRHIGNTGLRFINSYNCEVLHSNIYDTGGTGIYMDGGERVKLIPSGNKIENCHIYNFGRTYYTYAGGIRISGCGNTVTGNTLHDSRHYAIGFSGNDNIIESNKIYDVVTETSDAGAIYCGRNWSMYGNVIRYNFIRDIRTTASIDSNSDAHGIYIDDNFSGVSVYGNILVNISRAVLIGGGRDITLSDNMLAGCTKGIYYDDRGSPGKWNNAATLHGGALYISITAITSHPDYAPELWAERYPGFEALAEEAMAEGTGTQAAGLPKNSVITKNVYAGASGASYNSIAGAVSTYGTVSNNYLSANADIGFRDMENGDYNLSPNSAVFVNIPGFAEIPVDDAGIYTNPVRKAVLTYSDDKKAVTSLKSVASKNITAETVTHSGAKYVFALYDSENKLVNALFSDNTPFTADIPAEAENSRKLKLFFWDGDDTMAPLDTDFRYYSCSD